MTTVGASKPPEAAKPTKRTTRSSIRHSLNFASVGKALADVMNKEKEKDGNDTGKRDSGHKHSASTTSAKDKTTRRTSTILTKGGKTLDPLPEGQAKGNTTPDEKTVTSRKTGSSLQRAGRSSVDEAGVKVTSTVNGPSSTMNSRPSYTLRPRKPPVVSALPKYRPKSVIIEGSPKENLSAVRAGTRRKHSTSEEDRDSSSLESKSINDVPLEMAKVERPISPLPRRTSKNSGSRSASIDCGKRSPAPRGSLERTPTISTPPHPKKTQKPTPSPVLKKSTLPRPSPRGDSSSDSPHTPSSAKKIVSRYLPGLSGGRDSPSPLRASTAANNTKRRNTITKDSVRSSSESNQNTPTAPLTEKSGNAKADQGNDSVDDIEMMLAAVASPSAPTPAIPRIGFNYGLPPLASTPPRNSNSILDLSLGFSTPQSDRLSLPSSRRPTPNRRPAADRNSTAAWQALADLSLEINADQLQGGLIKELDLPTTPLGLVSPSPSMMRIESDDGSQRSPTPLNLPSPSKYGSISQMLLPTVTPFPPPISNGSGNLHKVPSTGSDGVASEAAAITLLKLQLASMENLARERLTQISRLEEQMHEFKESRRRDERELLMHVNELEERLHETLAQQEHVRSRAVSISARSSSSSAVVDNQESHAACTHSLEQRMREIEDEYDQTLSQALSTQAERERAERARLLNRLEQRQRLAFALRDAHQQWNNVHEVASGETEAIRANRETLAVLRTALDVFEAQIVISRSTKIPPTIASRFHLT